MKGRVKGKKERVERKEALLGIVLQPVVLCNSNEKGKDEDAKGELQTGG